MRILVTCEAVEVFILTVRGGGAQNMKLWILDVRILDGRILDQRIFNVNILDISIFVGEQS
jgi:hypothetical protein